MFYVACIIWTDRVFTYYSKRRHARDVMDMCVQVRRFCLRDITCHVHGALEHPFRPSSRLKFSLLLSWPFSSRCGRIQYCVRRSDRGTRVLVVQEMAEEPQGGELTISTEGIDTANLQISKTATLPRYTAHVSLVSSGFEFQ